MKAAAIALLLSVLSTVALADDGPPPKSAILEFLGAHDDSQDIDNYYCDDAPDGRGYICAFNVSRASGVQRERVRALQTKDGWDFTILH